MRSLLAVSASLLVFGMGSDARGHGFTLKIGAAAGRITAGDGLPLAGGYANWAFDRGGGSGEDGFDLGLFTTTPGFEWTTFPQEVPLTLEAIGRPDHSVASRPLRWLWHWDLATNVVDAATEDAVMNVFEIFGNEEASFDQLTPPTDATVPVLPLGSEHHLLLYQLVDAAPRSGVYGFFARLTAPGFLASEPFLIAFAYNAGELDFAAGTKSINAAAGLAGDFDVDGDVDGGDLLQWQRTLGATGSGSIYPGADGSLDGTVNAADLAIWRADFGRKVVYPPPSLSTGAAKAPEPAGGMLLAVAATCAATTSRRRRRMRPRKERRWGET